MTSSEIQDAKMAGEGNGSFPALGFDPAPGNAGHVGELGKNYTAVATHLRQACADMDQAGKANGFWQGDAGQAFHDKVGELPKYLRSATESLGTAGKALDGWHQDLTAMQRQAQELERQAAGAKQQAEGARNNPDLKLANQHFDNDQALQDAQNRLNNATQQLNKADGQLEQIREQAKQLFEQHQELVNRVERALKGAEQLAPKEGFFEAIGNAIKDIAEGIKDLAGKVWNWVKEHADVIKAIGDVLSKVSDVLSVIAAATSAIPVIGEVTSAAAMATSGLALGAHGLAKAAGADVPWSDIAGDAAGLIPFGAGKAVMKGVKAVGEEAGTKVLKTATKAGRKEFGTSAKALRETVRDSSPKELAKKGLDTVIDKGVRKTAKENTDGLSRFNEVAQIFGKKGTIDHTGDWKGVAASAAGQGINKTQSEAVSYGVDQAKDAMVGDNDKTGNAAADWGIGKAEGKIQGKAEEGAGALVDKGVEKIADGVISRRG